MSREITIGPYSAYAIAVKYGYTGTEQQWIAEQEASRLAAAQSAADASTAATRAENAQQAAEAAKGDALDAIGSAKTAAVTAVTDTKTAATKAVSAAQTAATAAVEKKGKDVLASIPEDYTALSESVGQVKEEIVKQTIVENQQISKFGIRKKYHKIFAKYNLPDELTEISSKINVYTDGSSVYHDFDIEKYKNRGGKEYYVAPNGNGPAVRSSYENPTQLRNILNQQLLNDGDTVYFTDGVYRDISTAEIKQITKSINLIALNKGKATIAMVGAPLQYTKELNGIYSTQRSNVLKVFQLKDDNIFALNKVSSENECEAQGTWNLSTDNVLKLHLFGDEQPTFENCIVCLNYGVPLLDFCPDENANLYCDGINFIGGSQATALVTGLKNQIVNFWATDCKFYGSYDSNLQRDAISIRGANAYFVRCEAQYSSKDGFNYHALNGNTPNFIEINCIGANNGNDGIALADNQYWQNGSTAHDGVKGLRIGGYYYNNYGGNVADVHENTITVNIGCTAFDSSAPKNKPDACADFVAQQAGAKMLLLGCRAFGSVSSARAVTNSEITVISCDLENGTSGPGTIN